MRLHRLQVTAFGPFAGTVDLDFDDVSAGGLFLVHGPTGAGKTSLLDAVCFALYAGVPGARPSGRSLRSDHAERDVTPTVVLEFSAGGRRLRVTRSPEFPRPKKRGAGETVTPAKVSLEELADRSWRVLSARADEVAEVVDDVLGMGLEQFSRVVLLPQGEFAAFLRASVEERRQVLERLFDVSSFVGVERWLSEQRRAHQEQLAAQERAFGSDVAVLVDTLARVPGSDVDRPEQPQGRPELGDSAEPLSFSALSRLLEQHGGAVAALAQLPRALGRCAEQLQRVTAQALTDYDAATGRDQAAARRLERARVVLAALDKARRARALLAELEEQREAHEADLVRLARAEAAAAVSGELSALGRAQRAVADAERAVADVERDVVGAWGGAGSGTSAAAARAVAGIVRGCGGDAGAAPAGATAVNRSAVVHSWVKLLAAHDDALGEARRVEAAMQEDDVKHADEVRRLSRCEQELALTQAQLPARVEECARAEREVAEAEQAAAALDGLVGKVAEAARILRLRVEQDRCLADLAALHGGVLTARTVEQDAHEQLLDLREARLGEMAGELAEGLLPGDACPVCGSCRHPAPAGRSRTVTPADLTAAECSWDESKAVLRSLELNLSALGAARDSRAAELAGSDAAALRLAHAEAQQQLFTTRARAETRARVLAARLAASTAADKLRAQVELLAASRAGLVSSVADLARRVEVGRVAVAAAVADHDGDCPCGSGRRPGGRSAESALAHHQGVLEATRRHLAALQRLDQATELRDEADAGAATALRQRGFDDAEQARAAQLQPGQRSALQERLALRARAQATAAAVLADEDVRQAEQDEAPDLPAAVAESNAARTALLDAKGRHTTAEAVLRDVQRLSASIAGRCASMGPALAEQARLAEMAELVTGTGAGNAKRMRLSSFVLAARLERVVALANHRLAVMGDGRYQLQHDDGLAARGARSGLGLAVRDLWTGQCRGTATLSGGESFMASLALALGLADAVREEAGGFDLQTLFVDEGFGTLDEGSLEQVMGVLDGLREGGRAVGIVSHVSDLRARITAQIAVAKTPHGSTARVLTTQDSAPAA